MQAEDLADGVLICGAYGVGKTTVAAEIANTLERRGVAYGAVDLDWLTWFDRPGLDRAEATRTYHANVADVIANYRRVGVRHVVLAGAIRDRQELDALTTAAAMPLRVVRLEVPIDEIARRLADDPTSGRRDDLAAARTWLDERTGVGVEDLVLVNDGSVPELAARIIDWLGWVGDGTVG